MNTLIKNGVCFSVRYNKNSELVITNGLSSKKHVYNDPRDMGKDIDDVVLNHIKKYADDNDATITNIIKSENKDYYLYILICDYN